MTVSPLSKHCVAKHSDARTIGDRQFLFIIGCARSGTTLLSQTLNSHPEVFVLPETKFFQFIWSRRYWLRLIPRARRTRRIVQYLLRSEYSSGAPIFSQYTEHISHAVENCPDLRDAFFRLLQSFSEAPVIGEKTPWHTFFVPELLASGRKCKIIAICRDAPAVVASLWNRSGFRRVNTIQQCTARWILMNNEIVKLRSALCPDHLCLVRYEDLVRNPLSTANMLFDWLGVAPADVVSPSGRQDSSLRDRHASARPVQTECSDYDLDALHRWQHFLNPAEVDFVMSTTASVAKHFGYERNITGGQHVASLWCEQLFQRIGVAAMRSGFYPLAPTNH